MNIVETLVYQYFNVMIDHNGVEYRVALNKAFLLGTLLSAYINQESDELKQIKLQAITKRLQEEKISKDEIDAYMAKISSLDDEESSFLSSEDDEGDAPLLHRILIKCSECEGQNFNTDTTEKLTSLFGYSDNTLTDQMNALNFLCQFVNANKKSKIPVHDACLFEIPAMPEDTWTPEIWSKLMLRYVRDKENLKIIFSIMKSAHQIEENHQKSGTKVKLLKHSPMDIKSYLNSYANKDKHPEAAKLFFSLGLAEEIFNDYLTLKPVDDLKLIPAITITQGKLTLSRLNASDPLAAVLGALTGCCQLLKGYGDACVRYGIQHPAGGFYVMRNPKGKIVSQFFAWRAGRHFCIDSLESCEEIFNAPQNQGADVRLVEAFANELVTGDYGIDAVHIGTGGRTPKDFGGEPLVDEKTFRPVDFADKDFRDSERVRTIAISPKALLAQLGVKDESNWLCQALQNLTHVEQLIYLAEGITEKNKQWFNLAFKRELLAFGKENAVLLRDKRHGNLRVAGIVLAPKQFALVCDVMQCDQLTSDDFNEIYTKLNDVSRAIFVKQYFNINGDKEWWKKCPQRINSLRELCEFVNACETDEQLLQVKDLLTGGRAVTGVDKIKAGAVDIESRLTTLARVMGQVELDKRKQLYFLFRDEIKSYTDIHVLGKELEKISAVVSDIESHYADCFDNEKDKFLILFFPDERRIWSPGLSKFFEEMVLKKLDFNRGGIKSVKDYIAIINAKPSVKVRDAIIENICLRFNELPFTTEDGQSLCNLLDAITGSHKGKVLLCAAEIAQSESTDNLAFIFEQYLHAINHAKSKSELEHTMVRINANIAGYIKNARDFQLVWSCLTWYTRAVIAEDFINGVISQKLVDPVAFTDKADEMYKIISYVSEEHIDYVLNALYRDNPNILFVILKKHRFWFPGNHPAMKILFKLFIDKIDYGDDGILEAKNNLPSVLDHLSPDDANKVVAKIKSRIPVDENYLYNFRNLNQGARDLVYDDIAAYLSDATKRTAMMTSFSSLTCLVTLFPGKRGEELFTIFVKNNGLSPAGAVIKSFVMPPIFDADVLIPFTHAQRDIIFDAVMSFVSTQPLDGHLYERLPKMAQMFTPIQSRALLQAASNSTVIEEAGYKYLLTLSSYDPLAVNVYLDICLGRICFGRVLDNLKFAFGITRDGKNIFSKEDRVCYFKLLLEHPITAPEVDRKLVLAEIESLEQEITHQQAIVELDKRSSTNAAWIATLSAREYCERLATAKQKWQQLQNKNANRKFKFFKCTEDELRMKLDKESRILLEADQAANQTFSLLVDDSNVGRMTFK